MKNIAIFITTYNRPSMLMALLQDIKDQSRNLKVNLVIINDHSKEDYRKVEFFLRDHFQGKYTYLVNPENYGKKQYWKTVNKGYGLFKGTSFDYFFQIADDMRLVDKFFQKAIQEYDAILDKKKACLNTSVDFSRLMKPFWTSIKPHACNFGSHEYIKTGWTDMCLVSSRRYLEALNFSIAPVDPRWSGNKELSSGVGMQISKRLISLGWSIYSLKKSLVISDDHPSVMHPDLRKDQKLITNHDMDRITATMATMPGREDSLKLVIASIIDQVDEMRIYANNMTEPVVKHRKLKWLFSNDHIGDLGDAGKFYGIDDIRGYHFTVDDDLLYPPDYVFTLISNIEKYERRCVISCHGRSFPAGHIGSYYKGAINRYPCLRTVAHDVFAHVCGTGVLAYHTSTIRIPFEIFEATNMADIWFSRYCQIRRVPRLVIAHQGGWIKDTNCYDQFSSIYYQNVNDESVQVQAVNSVVWTLP